MCLLLVVVLVQMLSVTAFAQFEIENYDVKVRLHKNGVVSVDETISVLFTEDRRGIIRNIPWALDNGKGSTRATFLHIKGVLADGTPSPYKKSNSGGEITLKIGDKDIFFPAGTRRVYTLQYDVENAINWFDKTSDWQPSAELYWNAIGPEWTAPIRQAKVEVSFDAVKKPTDVRVRAFSGAYGSSDSVTKVGAGTATQNGMNLQVTSSGFTLTKPAGLNAYEAFTFVLSLPGDHIDHPSALDQIRFTVLPNLGFGIPILTLIFCMLAYVRFGKDPSKGPMVVTYEPPDRMSGPECGTMLDERVDMRDLGAGIVSLAVKGHLKIEPVESGIIFKKKGAHLHLTGKADLNTLSTFEAMLLGQLRQCSSPIDDMELRKHVAPTLQSLKTSLYQSLVDRGFYRTSPEQARNVFLVVGIFGTIAAGALCMFISPIPSFLPSIVGGVISIIVVALFSKSMPQRTRLGARAHDQLRGFEDFIRRAQGQELEHMVKNRPAEAIFEEYLPHAIAFGLALEWSKAFEGILHAMPDWYMVPYGTHYHYGYFGNDLVSMSDSLASASSTPPRSEGASGGGSGFSSGGGFSGGGFGGGGGSSW